MTTENKICLVWVNGDREAALNMLFMYALNSKLQGWWDEVRLIVWGPSAKLLAGDVELQTEIKQMAEAGVQVWACKACADRYGVSAALQEIGVLVRYTGEPFTQMLQADWKVLTI